MAIRIPEADWLRFLAREIKDAPDGAVISVSTVAKAELGRRAAQRLDRQDLEFVVERDSHPPEKITGTLEVGTNDSFEVVINFPSPPEVDAEGRHFVAFSPRQAQGLAKILNKKAAEALTAWLQSTEGMEKPNGARQPGE